MQSIRKKDALEYHSRGRPGKIEVVPSKPCVTQYDLSLAYSPGVAEPCLEIAANPDDVYQYTAKGNLVAVISNGTAVLGLGDIGPAAGKPVMEGKGVLFKRFADVDVFDIEVDEKDPERFIQVVRALGPTFGGINLEDIKAPECFVIEERLKALMDIPVFHDDQHGTAIITSAALLNALVVTGKDIAKIRVVVSGAGASAISCTNLYLSFGVRLENVLMVDRQGVIYEGREQGMNEYKARFAAKTNARTLADAMEGADVFLGLSSKGLVTPAMVASMAPNPVLFALANPDPEIAYDEAMAVRSDLIMGTGRSDHPNQVNNVLGFPFIFRGALDVRARAINEDMKKAAALALAELAREDVPEQVAKAYGGQRFHFGREYVIPKPFDPRVLTRVAPAVAKAAVDSGVARRPITDWDAYRAELERRINPSSSIMRRVFNLARSEPKRLVFPEGDNPIILRAAQRLLDEKLATPILIGRFDRIAEVQREEELDLEGAEFHDPMHSPLYEQYVKRYVELRGRKGATWSTAKIRLRRSVNFAMMMVHEGHADGVLSGLTMSYAESMRPALHVLGARPGEKVLGFYLVHDRNGLKVFADCTVNIDPSAEDLAHIAQQTARFVTSFGLEPKVAMLSFANFGASPSPQTAKVARAAQLARALMPGVAVDGEMQVDVAADPEAAKEYPFSAIQGDANVFVFPSLEAANIGYKLLAKLAGATVIGPILIGMQKPVNVIATGSDADTIFNLAAFTVIKAQGKHLAL